jgi:hypothetical protein
MSTATTTETTLNDGVSAKFRKTLIAACFTVILLVPKVLNLRRNERSWIAFRTLLGFLGAAFVVLPIGFWSSYFIAIIGLAMFITAILLPPAKTASDTVDKARDLGALVVVNGGLFQPGSGGPIVPVQLFVGLENLWALNTDLQPLLVICVLELISARAEEFSSGWVLRLRWADRTAIFAYSGVFAEHLARVAESTVQSVMHPSLPVLPQRRAASA